MKADKNEISLLVKLRMAYLEEDLGEINQTDRTTIESNLFDYFNKHLNYDLFAFIEKNENKIVSVAMLLIVEKPSSSNFINGKIGNILNVYTLPEYRHKGFSTKIINELIETGKEKCVDYFDLLATEEGYSLYKKMGFKYYKNHYSPMRLYY